ncbi:MAG: PqqD family protein [Bacteroidota bacterium]
MSARYRIQTPRVVHETIDGETVIIDFDTGSYFSLTGVGADVWALVEQTASADQIVAALVERYSAGEAEVREAIEALLGRLVEATLIAPFDGDTEAALSPLALLAGSPAFAAPVLQQFTDMQALLLLDPIHDTDAAGWPHPAPTS